MRLALLLALALLALFAAPAQAGFRDTCEVDGKLRICTGTVESFDGTPLDTTLTLPRKARRGKPLPLVVFLHGLVTDQGEYISPTEAGDDYKTVEFNNRWFAARGYAVLNYSARGHGESGGEIELASKHREIRDTHHLTGLLVDDRTARARKVAAVGGSYGGGQVWLLATVRGARAPQYGTWRSPKGKVVRLAAAVPQFTWTDLLASVAPNGRDDSRSPFGIGKLTLLNGFIATGNARLSSEVVGWLERFNRGEPYEGDPVVEEAKLALTQDRSAYWQKGFFRALRRSRKRQRSIPILAAQGWTDPIFPAGEAVQMYRRLRAVRRNYPIQLYFGDFEHLTAQVKIPDMRYYHRLAHRLLDRHLRGKRRRPVYDVRSAPTICDPERFGPVVRAGHWDALQPDRMELGQTGTRMTGSPVTDPRGAATDHVVVSAGGRGCVTTTLPPTPGVATWTWQVDRDFTMIGMPKVELTFSTVGTDVQLNSRLWDVGPDGVQTLITRGVYRLVEPPAEPQRIAYELFGNHWQLEEGHSLMLEVTGDDSPFFRRDNFPSATTIEEVSLSLPGEG